MMKQTRNFSVINLTILALAAVPKGTPLFAGCAIAHDGSSDYSVHQGSACHYPRNA